MRPEGRTARFCEAEFAGSRGVSATIPKFVSDQKKARRYFVSGIVQGVGYRFFVQRVAEKLDIGGYARNLFDGRVEVFAVGSTAQLDQLKSELKTWSKVHEIFYGFAGSMKDKPFESI